MVLRSLIVLFGSLTATMQSASNSLKVVSNIVGGTNVIQPGQYPYMVSIRYNNRHFCGGTIIKEQYVVTAGHCIDDLVLPPYTGITVVSGTVSLTTGGQIHTVSNVLQHPEWRIYVKKNHPNDIAVLKLLKPMVFDKYQNKIAITTKAPVEYVSAITLGWGSRTQGLRVANTILQKMETRVINYDTCSKLSKRQMNPEQICDYQYRGNGICQGDSGSPLVVNEELVGIASFIQSTCGSGIPDTFTNVFFFRRFIDEAMRKMDAQ